MLTLWKKTLSILIILIWDLIMYRTWRWILHQNNILIEEILCNLFIFLNLNWILRCYVFPMNLIKLRAFFLNFCFHIFLIFFIVFLANLIKASFDGRFWNIIWLRFLFRFFNIRIFKIWDISTVFMIL